MFSDSIIDQQSIQAYLETNYHVCGEAPVTLNIGIANSGLAALHTSHCVESALT